jgi:CsoR family transcriptional regulator, copper-sensing transcriptional repressor
MGSAAGQGIAIVVDPVAGESGEPDEASPGEHSRGYTHDKEIYLKRLRRIEGQVRGLQRMVSEDAYCIDVLTQVAAATKALQSVALGLLEEHLGHCVGHAVDHGENAMEAKVKEAAEAIARLVRS